MGLVLGALLMYWGYSLLNKKKQKELTIQQSSVLLEKVRSVCKLISVEGDFAEIYRYENRKGHFMPPALLRSQFETLEVPAYGIHLPVTLSVAEMLQQIWKAVGGSSQG